MQSLFCFNLTFVITICPTGTIHFNSIMQELFASLRTKLKSHNVLVVCEYSLLLAGIAKVIDVNLLPGSFYMRLFLSQHFLTG